MKQLSILIVLLVFIFLIACRSSPDNKNADTNIKAHKALTSNNPIMTHTFGADPTVLVYKDRIFIYMTGDTPEYDHYMKIKNNSYSTINTLRVISSADLVNWTYHEPIKAAGENGIAKWAQRSWAPAIVYKEVNGRDKFFLYFSNNANGVGILTADSPLGPWTDPIGKALITRQTPNCSDVEWLFDPAVFIDDDGKAYIYFGGGVPNGKEANPGTCRAAQLGSDMISLEGNPEKINVPYFFEASLMNKINGKYVFSYCTNWADDSRKAAIAIMTGNNPMGPFTLEKTLFKNPGIFFGIWGNNHHHIFEFKEHWYIAYHSQLVEASLGISGKGYRSPHLDIIKMKNGMIDSATGTKKGVEQVGKLDPYKSHQGAESAICAEISFGDHQLNYPFGSASALKKGSWLGVKGADFGDIGAKSITILARSGKEKQSSAEIRLGSPQGEVIGVCEAKPGKQNEYTINLNKTITGIHDIFFVFDIDFELGAWQFNN